MSFGADEIYELLPAVHRIRDSAEGEPLRQLLTLVAGQVAILEEDLAQLYDNQFIETCAPWVLPYIGDVIGYTSLHPIGPDQFAPRAEVANTIGYRRRKGTASVLEQLARDVTGWNARAVEFFQLLATTQFLNHLRLTNNYAPDLRQWEPLERLGTAFETTAHTVDVRHVAQDEGKYNIPNIGIFLWRLNAYRLRGSPAVRVDDRRFLFHPLGADAPLFTRPQTEKSITHLAEPMNVPEPLSRRVFDAARETYYGSELSLFIDGVELDDVCVCNLSDDGATWAHSPPNKPVAIDPVLGRISFAVAPVETPRVTFHYGFSAALGGGEYERKPTFDAALAPIETVLAPGLIQTALTNRASGGVVEIGDSDRYEQTPAVALDPGVRLEWRAANEHRPTLIATGPVDLTGGTDAELTLNGLLIAGGPVRLHSVLGGGLRKLRLLHCTLVPGLSLGADGAPTAPGTPSLLLEQTDVPIEVEIDHCIVGAIRAPLNAKVTIRNSIVDANDEASLAYGALDGVAAGGTLTVINSTIIGRVHTALLKLASNSIFLARAAGTEAPVRSERQQSGCVRFSWLPLEARVPRRYRCQPDYEIAQEIDEAVQKSPTHQLTDAERAAIRDAVVVRLVPAFTSLRCIDPGYAQLRLSAPEQIRTGADDESEMGAFHDVFAPQRESNLRVRLGEYLRFGLEAGIFYQT